MRPILLAFTLQIVALATIINVGVIYAEQLCNGFVELCELNIEQVTLAGTHNSAAGFASHLNYHTAFGEVKAISCFYRSQMHSIYKQLELGKFLREYSLDITRVRRYYCLLRH